jgi:hypothetical protein
VVFALSFALCWMLFAWLPTSPVQGQVPTTNEFAAVPGEDYSGEGNVLLGIAAAGPGDIWAAGYHYPSGTSDYQGLIEHYDGKQWRRVSSAQGGSYTYLSGITAWTPGAAWAVGNTLTATIAESVYEIQVSETGFAPTAAPAIQGDTIAWTIIRATRIV